MSEKLEQGICNPLTSLLGDSRAKTSRKPIQQPMESADNAAVFGRRCGELFASYDLVSCSWRTCQHLLTGDLAEFSETWPRAGMIRNGTAYPLRPLAPLTYETEFGYLPTPQASDSQFRLTVETNCKILWDKETTGKRQSGAQIGSCLRRSREFVMEQLRTGGDVNPEWCEVLMGYPTGWTELELSETQLCPKSRSGLESE